MILNASGYYSNCEGNRNAGINKIDGFDRFEFKPIPMT